MGHPLFVFYYDPVPNLRDGIFEPLSSSEMVQLMHVVEGKFNRIVARAEGHFKVRREARRDDGHTDQHADTQADARADTQTHRLTQGHTDTRTDTQTHSLTHRHTD